MISELDVTMKSLLQNESTAGSLLEQANISFAVPNQEWQQTGSTLDLNLYLYDIRENKSLRSNEIVNQYKAAGYVLRKKVAPRISCAYLITAWDKSNNPDKDQKILQEHSILTQVMQVLLKNATIKSQYLFGSLTEQEVDLPLTVTIVDGLPNPVEFWNALGSPLKPSVNCVVTISLDLLREPEKVPTVINKYISMGQGLNPIDGSASAGTGDRNIQIGGKIVHFNDFDLGISDTLISIPSLNKSMLTDKDGYYSFDNIPEGSMDIFINKAGYGAVTIPAKVPSTKSYEYSIYIDPVNHLKPQNFNVSEKTETTITVFWTAPVETTTQGVVIEKYEIKYSINKAGGESGPETIIEVAGTALEHTIDNLVSGASYKLSIRAMDTNTVVGYWVEGTVSTQ